MTKNQQLTYFLTYAEVSKKRKNRIEDLYNGALQEGLEEEEAAEFTFDSFTDEDSRELKRVLKEVVR